MAEIRTWDTVHSKVDTVANQTMTATTRTVTVASLRPHARFTVSILRDLVAALDAAGVPDNAIVESHRTEAGHLHQLTVEHKHTVEPAEVANAGAEDVQVT